MFTNEIIYLIIIIVVLISIFIACQDLISILIYTELFALNVFLYIIYIGVMIGDKSGSEGLAILFIIIMAGESTIALSILVNYSKMNGNFSYIMRKLQKRINESN